MTDPTGHKCVGKEGECEGENGKKGHGFGIKTPKAKQKGTGGCGGDAARNCDGTPKASVSGLSTNITNQSPWYSDITDFTVGILSNPNTSVTTSALQVVSGTVMVVGIGLLAIPGAEPLGAALAVGGFAVNRSAALIGTAATYYQYSHQLNGVNKVDVAVNLSTTIVGTVPDLSEGAALVSFAYDFINTVVPNLLGE